MSSGTIAGRAAAKFAKRAVAAPGDLRSAARAGIPESRPGAAPAALPRGTLSPDEVVANVQAEVLTPAKCLFRTAVSLKESLSRLDEIWADQVPRIGSDRGRQKAREAAAMTAHARWMYRSSLARPESRGIHCREDHAGTDPALTLRLRTGGLDEVWVRQGDLLTAKPPVTEGAR
jgi:succinate dehydrogenase/fumarate reductase flavoprotein subunit